MLLVCCWLVIGFCSRFTGIKKTSPWVKGLETRRQSLPKSLLLQEQRSISDRAASPSHGYPRLVVMEKLDGPVRKLLELPLRLLSASATGATGISTLIQPFLQRNSTCREKQPLAFVVSPGGLIMGRNLSRIDTGFGATRGWVCQLPPRPWNSGHMSIKYLEYFALLKLSSAGVDYTDMRMSCRTGQPMMRLKFRPI